VNDRLVIEEKGIYSLEKFIIARRLMYWQVYMHKTVLSSESLLVNILKRAKELASDGKDIYSTPALRFFLYNNIGKKDLGPDGVFSAGIIASNFTKLDDSDILVSAKYWTDHSDMVLSDLSRRLMQRDLLAIELQNDPFPEKRINEMAAKAADMIGINGEVVRYYVYTGNVSNLPYAPDSPEVNVLTKSGSIVDIQSVSDMVDHHFLSERVIKYFFCYPKECR
jgi:HD superfamily phosphohydrolase